MTVAASTTNVVDLPCVPVRHRDQSTKLLSLRDALVQAHELSGLADELLPVEREALLRLLESLAAVILHGADPDDLEDDPRLHPELVDGFFTKHGDLFDLADRDKPLLQEWHTPDPTDTDLAKTFQPIEQMHLRVPGGSSARWGLTDERRDAHDPAVLFVLLAVSWFHGKPSNAAGAHFYVPTSGTKCSPISGAPSGGPHDTVFHLVGDSLAESLLLNIPEAWLEEGALPAWLDQDATPRGLAKPGSLWRCTWTANRALVRWDEGRAVSFTRGLTRRPVPLVGVADADGGEGIAAVKNRAKAVASGDYCRVRHEKTSTKTVTKHVHANASLRSAEGFEKWYRDDLAASVHSWVNRHRALDPARRRPRLGWHHEEGDTYGNRELTQWVEIPLGELVLPEPERDTLIAITQHVSTIRKALGSALATAAIDGRSPVRGRVLGHVLAALDEPVLQAVQQLARTDEPRSTVVVDDVLRDMTRRARNAFTQSTEPLLTPATAASIYRARRGFAIRTAVKEI